MTNDRSKDVVQGSAWRLLAEFPLPDEPGGEDRVMALVIQAVHELSLSPTHLEQLLAILMDAARSALQGSRSFQPGSAVVVRVFVQSLGTEHLTQGATVDEPGEQATRHSAQEAGESGRHPIRGWGYFLIDRMLDSVPDLGNVPQRAIELYLYLEGGVRGTESTRSSAPQ